MEKHEFLAVAPRVGGIDWGQLWDKLGPIAVQALVYFLQRVQQPAVMGAAHGHHGCPDLDDETKQALESLAQSVRP